MISQEDLVSEYKASAEEDLRNRQKSIDEGEALDKKISQYMDKGELGVSHGTDNHIGVIMFSLATVFTLFCIYIIFEMNPVHFNG